MKQVKKLAKTYQERGAADLTLFDGFSTSESTISLSFWQQESALGRTKGGKDPGADNIPNVIKMMSRKGKVFLFNIFNLWKNKDNFIYLR